MPYGSLKQFFAKYTYIQSYMIYPHCTDSPSGTHHTLLSSLHIFCGLKAGTVTCPLSCLASYKKEFPSPSVATLYEVVIFLSGAL